MAVTGKFNCLDILSLGSRKSGTVAEYTEIWLDPREVEEAPQNTHKECRNIEQLAESFLLTGQEQPTVLARVNGEYRIVDGHRRNRANIYLIEQGYKEYEKVRFSYKDMTENMYELSLLVGNGFTQDLTPYEKTELAARLKSALKKAIEAGEIEQQGKLRDMIGDMLGETSGQMGRIEKINSSLTEEAKEQFKAGNMGISAAYETAKLPEEEQRKVAGEVAGGKRVEVKDIKSRVKERQQAKKEKKQEEMARRAGGTTRKAECVQTGTAQDGLETEPPAKEADEWLGMNPPVVSESDTAKELAPEEVEKEAAFTLQELMLQTKNITYNELLVLQDILMKCNNRCN